MFFGGVPAQVVPDNLKSAVIKACFYDPAINRTYGDMAAHYDTAVVPARPRKPKDKAKVEGAVLLAERWILARLRNQTFFGLDELNAAIRPLRDQLNEKVTRHLGASRHALFETLDKPALKPLPREPYVYAEWKKWAARIGPNVETFVEMVMRKRRHPEQGYRTCMGVLRLAKTFGASRLDAACERALEINSYTYQSLHSILKNGLDRQRRETTTDGPAITHPNIRGADYFH